MDDTSDEGKGVDEAERASGNRRLSGYMDRLYDPGDRSWRRGRKYAPGGNIRSFAQPVETKTIGGSARVAHQFPKSRRGYHVQSQRRIFLRRHSAAALFRRLRRF